MLVLICLNVCVLKWELTFLNFWNASVDLPQYVVLTVMHCAVKQPTQSSVDDWHHKSLVLENHTEIWMLG